MKLWTCHANEANLLHLTDDEIALEITQDREVYSSEVDAEKQKVKVLWNWKTEGEDPDPTSSTEMYSRLGGYEEKGLLGSDLVH